MTVRFEKPLNTEIWRTKSEVIEFLETMDFNYGIYYREYIKSFIDNWRVILCAPILPRRLSIFHYSPSTTATTWAISCCLLHPMSACERSTSWQQVWGGNPQRPRRLIRKEKEGYQQEERDPVASTEGRTNKSNYTPNQACTWNATCQGSKYWLMLAFFQRKQSSNGHLKSTHSSTDAFKLERSVEVHDPMLRTLHWCW